MPRSLLVCRLRFQWELGKRREQVSTAACGGPDISFSDGTRLGFVLADQDGYLINEDGTHHVWHRRRFDLTSYAGKTIANTVLLLEGCTTAGNSCDIYFEDMAIVSTDGTVSPIYNGQSAINFTLSGSSGIVNPSYEVNRSATLGDSTNTLNTTRYYHGDHLGSARLLTAGGGWPIQAATYLPFGQEWNPQITVNHYKFTGDERDAESGLDHTQFRQYSSQLGRWIHPDPAGLAAVDPTNPQSWNRYAYVLNSPMILTDPSGLDPGGLTPGDICLVDDTEPVCGFPAQILAGDPGGSGGCTLNPFSTALVPICAPGVGGGIVVGIGGQSGGGTIPPIPVPNNPGTTFPGNPVGQQVCVQIGVSTVYCTSKPLPAWIIDLLADGEAAIIDARVNNLSQAVNSTGVQSLGNPCTIVGFYGASAAGGFLGGAAVGGEAAPVAAGAIASSTPYIPAIFRYFYTQSQMAFAPFFRTASNASKYVQNTCNALQ
jgi:RHS repeat-associated protein